VYPVTGSKLHTSRGFPFTFIVVFIYIELIVHVKLEKIARAVYFCVEGGVASQTVVVEVTQNSRPRRKSSVDVFHFKSVAHVVYNEGDRLKDDLFIHSEVVVGYVVLARVNVPCFGTTTGLPLARSFPRKRVIDLDILFIEASEKSESRAALQSFELGENPTYRRASLFLAQLLGFPGFPFI
jgi:hypothetical protein